MMQIVGTPIQAKIRRSVYFCDGKIKEQAVVCLKFYRTPICQDIMVTGEKLFGRKPSCGMPCLGPWVGKVQVDAVDFPGSKGFCDAAGIHADEADI